jgi:SAM-dependent methyltransferase
MGTTSDVEGADERWAGGLGEELGYWLRYLRDRGGDWPEDFAHRTDPSAPLQAYVRRHVAARVGSRVRILDVGSGPLTILGKRWRGRRVEIAAVDPLADRYAEMFDRYDIEPLVRPVRGDAERLTDLFPAGSFDAVYAQNCIDHGWDPMRSIAEMLEVARPGGVVLLKHAIDESERMGYAGLHQWNFRAEDGRFVISRPGLRVDAHAELERVADVELEIEPEPGLPEIRWLHVALRKPGLQRSSG